MSKFTQNTLRLFVLLIFGSAILPLQAAHIIGGVITYECQGGGDYKFTMKIYRDCYGNGALFDSDPQAPFAGTVTIYQGASTVPIDVILLGTPNITNVLPNISNPCLTPPSDVCVEEGVYFFNLNLPTNAQSYHIVYQRCCRNNSISNIVNPGEQGATYWMELTAAAQQACNNSPVFNDFPPIVICSNEPINFDHAATDPDGDQLVYELCTPFVGGGTDQGNPTASNGVAPDPDLPPPFDPVNYITPTYSFSYPVISNPAVSIDPTTGFLTGVPLVAGQFVVGICVKEYRNGVLLSVVRREFQFNVEECQPTVVAQIMEDDTVTLQGQQYYVVNACGENAVKFENESFQVTYINDYRWEFDINGATQTFNDWSPTVDFPGIGTYYGALMLNPGTNCGDTALIEVNVFPGIESDFSFSYDTCIASPVVFTDQSFSGAGVDAIQEWQWQFGDGDTSPEQNPVHNYQVPGDLPVTLLVRDVNDCTGISSQVVRYFPVPEYLVVAPSEYIGCQPADIFFNNLSFPVDTNYLVEWDFGDGFGSGEISPNHIFNETGTFTISLHITSPLGCENDTIWHDLITVLPSPTADFSYLPEQPSNLVPTVTFTDESIEAVKWKWLFDEDGFSIEQNPVFTFPDTGMQTVQLVVHHVSGCTDTLIQLIDVIPEVRYYLPNAFTPDNDGTNDGFRGAGVMEGATNFSMTIWNRYGELVFQTTDPYEAWNGKKNNDGGMSPQGVYPVVVKYNGPRGDYKELRGYATLIK